MLILAHKKGIIKENFSPYYSHLRRFSPKYNKNADDSTHLHFILIKLLAF